MQKTKKSSALSKIFFILTALLLFAVSLPAAENKDPWWWQEEIAPPPEGQIINPEYITKRDELERFWSQTNRDSVFAKQYFQWTSRARIKYYNSQRAFLTAVRLEHELEKIPVYVPKPSEPGSESAAPAQQPVL